MLLGLYPYRYNLPGRLRAALRKDIEEGVSTVTQSSNPPQKFYTKRRFLTRKENCII